MRNKYRVEVCQKYDIDIGVGDTIYEKGQMSKWPVWPEYENPKTDPARASASISDKNKVERAEDRKTEAWVVAESCVKDRLRSPSTADFGGFFNYQDPRKCVTYLGNSVYQVRGWVDSQNGFGATVRTDFCLKVEYVSKETWRLVEPPTFVQR